MFIVIVGGIVGFIGLRKKEVNNIVLGVVIVIVLMLFICIVGYGLVNGNVWFLFGVFYFFLINCVFIMLINIVGIRIMMRKFFLSLFKELNIKMRIGLIFLIVLLIFLVSYLVVILMID